MPLLRGDLRLLRSLILLFGLLPACLWLRIGQASAARPNVIVIQTDDQAAAELRARFHGPDQLRRPAMPNTLRLIARQGTEFTRYYATQPLCGPSRAALLTGRYAHTTGLRRNRGPNGGWTGWQELPLLNDNLAVSLQNAGYRTIHVGKFTNNYVTASGDPEATVPPGWDRWNTMTYDDTLFYYGYSLNRDGVIEGPFGSSGYDPLRNDTDPVTCTAARLVEPPGLSPDCLHATDLYTRSAVSQIRAAGDRPFYLQLDYNAPHGDSRNPAGPEPTPRHYDTAFGNRMPRSPSWNEADIRDKPRWLRQIAAPLTRNEIAMVETRWNKDLESLRDVDDGVGAIVRTLRDTGHLGNTYIMFLSDNGFFHGQHRFSGAKFLAYEPAARVPFLIRGPGIPARGRSGELVGNIDIAPTVLDLTGAGNTDQLDGRSMRRFWSNPARRTRRPLFIESWAGPGGLDDEESGSGAPDTVPSGASVSVLAPPTSFRAVRAGRFKYVEYRSGEVELYDLARDPDELDNRVNSPAYRAVRTRLAAILRNRMNCRAGECRRPTSKLPRIGGRR